jgi:succinyl-CoA synthetase beta subunit
MIGSMTVGPLAGLRSRASIAKTVLRGGPYASQKRFLSIHEYLAMDLLNSYGVATPKSFPAHSADEAFTVAKKFSGKGMVIKAQVLAGGRGKGHFDSGLQGGVHLIKT